MSSVNSYKSVGLLGPDYTQSFGTCQAIKNRHGRIVSTTTHVFIIQIMMKLHANSTQ